MRFSIVYVVAALSVVPLAAAIVSANPKPETEQIRMHNMNTNIAFGSSAEKVSFDSGDYNRQVLIDPSKLIEQVSKSKLYNDIEEDPEDRFITTRSGKPRQRLMRGGEADQWVEDTLVGKQQAAAIAGVQSGSQKVLSRKKRRCRNNDDGDANRSRRARRARSNRRAQRKAERRARKAAKKAARRSQSTTTVIRKIVPISEVNQLNGATTLVQQQPGTIVQSAVPATATTIQQPAQIIQQQVPQQKVVVPAAASIVATPVVAAPATAPSVSVQGSVNIN